jgi:hypothetical protein
METPREGFPFIPQCKCNDHPNRLWYGLAERSGGGNKGLNSGRTVRSQRRDRGRGKRDGRETVTPRVFAQ